MHRIDCSDSHFIKSCSYVNHNEAIIVTGHRLHQLSLHPTNERWEQVQSISLALQHHMHKLARAGQWLALSIARIAQPIHPHSTASNCNSLYTMRKNEAKRACTLRSWQPLLNFYSQFVRSSRSHTNIFITAFKIIPRNLHLTERSHKV